MKTYNVASEWYDKKYRTSNLFRDFIYSVIAVGVFTIALLSIATALQYNAAASLEYKAMLSEVIYQNIRN